MAVSLLSQDLVAICLLLTSGKINIPLEELIQKLESYQEQNNCHLGISRNDFRNLFVELLWGDMQNHKEHPGKLFKEILLVESIPRMLEYDYAHFNDEGEAWVKSVKQNISNNTITDIEYWFGYRQEEYEERTRLKEKLIKLFSDCDNSDRKQSEIKKLLNKYQINIFFLSNKMRPGSQS